MPEGEVEERLRCELALSLYAQGILSFGKATELSATLGAAFPMGQTLGQTANFRQTAPKIGVSPGFAAYRGPPPPKQLDTRSRCSFPHRTAPVLQSF